MVNEREKLIGARLRAFREILQVPRSRFAVTLGFGSERIASYESGRAPLPYIIFLAAFEKYSLSPEWLALGEGSPKWLADNKSFISKAKHSSRDSFSSVYDSQLSSIIGTHIVQIKAGVEEHIRRLNIMNNLMKGINQDSIPEKTLGKLKEMTGLLEDLSDRLRGDLIFRRRIETRISENDLTVNSLKSKIGDVKSELEKLIARVKRLASKPGVKSALAQFLDVAPARVTEWLNDDPEMRKEPGGQYTLKLLQWVEQQERQK